MSASPLTVSFHWPEEQAATSIPTVMRALPIGVPKLLVSTVASRDVSGFIGASDITLMHAVADIIGLNFMTKKILSDAAGAIVGMIANNARTSPERPVVGLTSYGPLNDGAFASQKMLEEMGYEVVPFHAIGTGSMAMEALVDEGVIHGALDLTLHEFVDHLFGGYCGYIGRMRLEAGNSHRAPRVILPGGLDMIVFETVSIEGFPVQLQNRIFQSHDFRSFVRTTHEDMVALAEIIADKLIRAEYPISFIVPRKGWSKLDSPGGPYYNPEINDVFVSELRSRLGAGIRMVEVDANINDEECARIAVQELHSLMEGR